MSVINLYAMFCDGLEFFVEAMGSTLNITFSVISLADAGLHQERLLWS